MIIPNNTCSRRHQRGTVLPFLIVILVVLLAFVALAVDVGYLSTVHTELRTAANSAALVGATGLAEGPDVARDRIMAYAAMHQVNGQPLMLDETDIEFGRWSPDNQTFIPLSLPSDVPLDAVRVSPELTSARGNAIEYLFAGILGHHTSDVGTSAVARYGSRDIMLVIDTSASMNDDSELQSFGVIGLPAIETRLFRIWTELGSPIFGNLTFHPVFEASTDNGVLLTLFGLDGVDYPFPAGSWEGYFNYVQTDLAVAAVGYQNMYGYLTLVNYWLAVWPAADETPGLYATSEQPITAVKDAVGIFFAFIEQVDTNDRVGLSIYTSKGGRAKLESPLTDDFELIEDTIRQRQAGHYTGATNIGAGIQTALKELDKNRRENALGMIVLLTDGIANLPTNANAGRKFAVKQAENSADDGVVILTISLGARADTVLLQEIADITGGIHFNVPTGASVEEYEVALNDVFTTIAAHRPARIVR